MKEALDGKTPHGASRIEGGRGGAFLWCRTDGESAVVRRLLRGGLFAPLLGDRHFGPTLRPVRELSDLERLASLSVPVPEGVGAALEFLGRFAYRGVVATRRIPRGQNLRDFLCAESDPQRRRAACAGAVRALCALERAGAVHPDLHLGNFVVDPEKPERVWIVDCDRLRWSRFGRRRVWRRVRDSVRKLDPLGRRVSPEWFVRGAA